VHYYGVVTHTDASNIQIPNNLVRQQFFDRLSKLTLSYNNDITRFIEDEEGNAAALQRALVKFSTEYFQFHMMMQQNHH